MKSAQCPGRAQAASEIKGQKGECATNGVNNYQ